MSEPREHEGERATGHGEVPPFMAPWMLAMKMWIDAMSAFIPGGPGMAAAWMEQMTAGGAPLWGVGAQSRARTSFLVTSRHPVEVSAVLDAGACFAKLSVDAPAHGQGASAAKIDDVAIHTHAGHARITVKVADGQTAGTYTGFIHDDMGARRGELTVTIKPDPRAAASARKK